MKRTAQRVSHPKYIIKVTASLKTDPLSNSTGTLPSANTFMYVSLLNPKFTCFYIEAVCCQYCNQYIQWQLLVLIIIHPYPFSIKHPDPQCGTPADSACLLVPVLPPVAEIVYVRDECGSSHEANKTWTRHTIIAITHSNTEVQNNLI